MAIAVTLRRRNRVSIAAYDFFCLAVCLEQQQKSEALYGCSFVRGIYWSLVDSLHTGD